MEQEKIFTEGILADFSQIGSKTVTQKFIKFSKAQAR